jgi:N4-gp56 family major capsid protein
MAITSTATTNFSSTVVALVSKHIEEALSQSLVHLTPGSYIPATFVKGTNGVLRWVAYPNLAVITATLTEGVAPTAQALTIGVDEGTAAQRGGVIDVTDLASMQSPHDLITEAAKKAAYQASLSMDEQARLVITAGTSNIVYSNGSARSAVSAVLSGTAVKKAFSLLQDNDVPKFPDGFYRGIIHPRAAFDLQNEATGSGTWVETLKYTNAIPLLANEIGMYGGVRLMVSTRATTFTTAGAAGRDVLQSVIFGPEAWAFGDPQSLSSHYTPPGGRGDELAQRASLGWKMFFGGAIADAGGAKYCTVESTGQVLKASGEV